MDKDIVKRVLLRCWHRDRAHVTFRPNVEHDYEAELASAGIGLPCFVKPARLGSSVGISKVRTHEELGPALELAFRHDRKVLVEEMIEGREVEVGLLGNDDPLASVPGELVVNAEWYDYDAKYLPGGMDLTVPADIDPVVAEELQRAGAACLPRLRLRRHGPHRLLRDPGRPDRPERDQRDPWIHLD